MSEHKDQIALGSELVSAVLLNKLIAKTDL